MQMTRSLLLLACMAPTAVSMMLAGVRAPVVAPRVGRLVDRLADVEVEAHADNVEAVKGVVVPTRTAAPVSPRPQAKPGELIKRYGGVYVMCSVSLSLCSFGFFYVLLSTGVDATALLRAVGIRLRGQSASVGRIALAYVLHKAASPLRFPPTVALTAVVVQRIEGWRGVAAQRPAAAAA